MRALLMTALLFLGVCPLGTAAETPSTPRLDGFLRAQAGSVWAGPAELWLAPGGYEVERSDARLRIDRDGIEYEWAWRGEAQRGAFEATASGLVWHDSWHQGEPVAVQPTSDTLALFAVEYAYPAGDGPDWHWRMRLSRRPDGGPLVLQMTNVTPWGEEARAVRMVLEPAP